MNGTEIRLKKVVDVSKVRSGMLVLDVGCGKEMILREYLPSKVDYTGVDIVGGTIQHDLEKGLPKLDNKFDCIFMNEFIEHIENFKTLLIECKQILKDDGCVVISTPGKFRLVYGDFFNGIGEDLTHIHLFGKSHMRNLSRIVGLNIDVISGTYISFPQIISQRIIIPSNNTWVSDVMIYRLVKQ